MAANPNFNQLNTDFSKPNPNVTGSQMAGRLGIQYDLDTIRQIFTDAANSKYGVTKKTYDDAIKAFYDLMSANQALQQQALSKTEAASVVNNNSEGLAAANKLSAILGGSQQASQGAQELALKQMLLGDQLGVDAAQAERDAFTQYNDIGAMLGQLINEMNAVQAQTYAAELAAAQQQGSGGGGYPVVKNNNNNNNNPTEGPVIDPNANVDPNAALLANYRNDGRFTQAIMAEFLQSAENDENTKREATMFGKYLDSLDQNGYPNVALQAQVDSIGADNLYNKYAYAIVDANTNYTPKRYDTPAQKISAIDPTGPQAKFPDTKIYPSNVDIPRADWKMQRQQALLKDYQNYNSNKNADNRNKAQLDFFNVKMDDKYVPSSWSASDKAFISKQLGKDKMVNANGTTITASKDNGGAERTAMLDFANANHDLYKATGGVANHNNASFLQAPQATEKDTFDLGKALASMFPPIPKSSGAVPTVQPYDSRAGLGMSLPGAPVLAQPVQGTSVLSSLADIFGLPKDKDKNKSKAAARSNANVFAAQAAPYVNPRTTDVRAANAGPKPYAGNTSTSSSGGTLSGIANMFQSATPKAPSSSSYGPSYGGSISKPIITVKPAQPTVGSLYNPQTGQVYNPKKNPGSSTAGIGQLDKYGNTMY